MNSITMQFTEKQLIEFGRIMESKGLNSLEDLFYEAAIQFMNTEQK